MDAERFERLQELFHAVADLPEAERRAVLAEECGGDTGLISAVLALVEEDAAGASVLDRDLAHVAGDLIGAPNEPRRCGPYQLLEVLGEGGMGVVYLAERTGVGGRVALKILRDAWLSPARRERFANEQRTLAQLNHPSIAQLYDADTLPGGTPWFAMEYVEGRPLDEYCRSCGIPLRERLRLVRAVSEAVQFAHAHAVIHRDLKPSNILVKDDGSVRLLDFGIAKHLDPAGGAADQTRTGLRLMTPAYAAPEQLRGEPVGTYTDVYALGVLLYELLAGRPPFEVGKLTPGEAGERIIQGEPERPSAAARRQAHAVSASGAEWRDLDVLCLKAMHKDPQRRYATAEALIRDIGRFLNQEPLEARPDTLMYRLDKFARRQWRALLATGAALLVVASLVAFFTARLATARNEALAEAARSQRIQEFMLKLFQGGDSIAGPSQDLRVSALLDRGVQEARSLDAEPGVQAELYETLGVLYQNLGDLGKAEQLLELALERRRSLFGEANAAVARSLVSLGSLRTTQARMEEAEALARQGVAMSRGSLPATHPEMARALSTLSEVLAARGSYPEAIEAGAEAARLAAGGPGEATLLYELANVEFYAGHHERSWELNQKALEMFRRNLGDRHPMVSDVLINLGAIRAEKGDYEGAVAHYREALAITEAWHGNDHPKTASNLTMLGRALVKLDRPGDALVALERAIAIQERHFGVDHPRVASALNELGSLARGLGRPSEAGAHYRRALVIWRRVHGDDHYLNAIAISNLASVELELGRMESAETMMRDALARFQAALGPENSNTGIARLKLGRLLLKRGKHRDAERELLTGLRVLEPQMEPSSPWLQAAQKDLAEVQKSGR